jgi:hypothetical protein
MQLCVYLAVLAAILLLMRAFASPQPLAKRAQA